MNQRAAFAHTVKLLEILQESGEIDPTETDGFYRHILGMEPRMDETFSEARLGRWLGWVQGVACAYGWLTLDQCKEINKKYAG